MNAYNNEEREYRADIDEEVNEAVEAAVPGYAVGAPVYPGYAAAIAAEAEEEEEEDEALAWNDLIPTMGPQFTENAIAAS